MAFEPVGRLPTVPSTPSSSSVSPRPDDQHDRLGREDEKEKEKQSPELVDQEMEKSAKTEHDIADPEPVLAGVRRVEAVTSTWTKSGLIIAYVGLYLMAFATSLEGQTTGSLTAYATSSFKAHSMISTVAVVQSVVNAVIKPPMAKLSDVVGRFEAFTFSVLLFTVGYIQQAASNNINTYVAAQIFYTAGSQGVQILQQIFIADTTNLLNRALFSSIPDLPFLVTVWVGPEIAQSLLSHSSWRWGYGIWAIILPAAFTPLGLSLWLNQRRAARRGLLPPSPFKGSSLAESARRLWFDMDVFGLILLTAGISLVLIPLTVAQSAKHGWASSHIIATIVVGGVCLIVFPFWERSARLAPHPFFPRYLLKDRTMAAGLAIAFLYFTAFYLSVFPYFFSYLQVVHGKSVTAAGRITQTFSFASTVSSVAVSVLIKWTGHVKYFVVAGSCVYVLGLGLMVRYRDAGVSTATLVGCQIVIGIGGGTLNVPVQLAIQASARHADVAAATTVFLTVLSIGGAVGSAVSGAIWTSGVPSRLTEYLPDPIKGTAGDIYGDITIATSRWPMGSVERDAINRAYQDTMRVLLCVAVAVAAPLVLLSLVLKNFRFKETDQNRDQVFGDDLADHHRHDISLHDHEHRMSSNSPGDEVVASRVGPESKAGRLWEKIRSPGRST